MEDIEFHFIELKKLNRSITELTDLLEIWTVFIRNADTLSEEEMQELETKNPALKKAHETLDEISQDSDTRLAYDRRKSAIFFYEKTLDQKFSEGKIEGKIEDVRKMREEGLPVDQILRITGLSLEDLKKAGILS